MKTKITVAWCNTVEVDVDETQLDDEEYLDDVRNKAVSEASTNIRWKDGVVTDCEDFPELAE
jgi:DNA-binding protein YbaB